MGQFLKWQEKWNTQIPAIDEQNMEMANLLNQIVDELQRTDSQEKKQNTYIDTMLSEFIELTLEHFNSEEEHMRQISYPRYSSHRQEHVMLKAELKQLFREIKEGQSKLDIGTLRALKHWYVAHLAGPDKDYADYYHANNLQHA